MSGSGMVASVEKALRALDFIAGRFADGHGATLGEIAEHVGIKPTTARNILKTMEACGYLSRGEGRTYCPGHRCADLLRGGTVAARLVDVGREPLVELARSTGESAVLTTLVSSRRHVLLRGEGGKVIRVDSSAADTQPFFGLVTSRAMVACLSPEGVDAMVAEHGLPGEAWDGIDDRQALDAALADIRERGCCEDMPSAEVGAMAAPVTDGRGLLAGAVGLYFPLFRCGAAVRKRFAAELMQTAAAMTAHL